VVFVIFQHGVSGRSQRFAVARVRIQIDRDHIGPLLKIFLAAWGEFVLIVV
jgi:hypothetical protein